ncbi:ATP-binding protein [Faecalicoccus pleomorphus]|uniref:ATP-binding protein n=1 Tax=Faecalicoccus pleomorphus TaxID=1323 RepID=UPI001898BA20|nr:ATP-binding protein [Faecalicoccus pleomorphus]MDB7984015.1 ATP-binding protein [Faecalicoccus pleomorphus]
MIKREAYMRQIRPFINTDLIKVLTGFRRSGKSVMLELIQEELLKTGVREEQCISINFENMKNAHLLDAISLHDEILRRIESIEGKVYLFFDEIQEVVHWEKCINSLRVELDCDIYITGSNAKLLSGELATYLAGRYVEFVIYPFSFQEFIELYHTIYPEETNRQCFHKYLMFGGMPYLANLRYDNNANQQYLRDLFNSVELKDIIKRNKIRDVDILERIIVYVTLNIGTSFSAFSISKYLKSEGRSISSETIMNYLKACMDAFMFYQVKREDLQGKKILTVNEKYYVVDHGIREAVFGNNQKDIQLVLENIVYMELLRRGYTVFVGKIDNQEIDFVCHKQNDKIYIQVSYLLASEETIAREFGVLDKVQDNYPKYVISMDEFDMSRNGIKHKNIIDFLLEPEWEH